MTYSHSNHTYSQQHKPAVSVQNLSVNFDGIIMSMNILLFLQNKSFSFKEISRQKSRKYFTFLVSFHSLSSPSELKESLEVAKYSEGVRLRWQYCFFLFSFSCSAFPSDDDPVAALALSLLLSLSV